MDEEAINDYRKRSRIQSFEKCRGNTVQQQNPGSSETHRLKFIKAINEVEVVFDIEND